MIAKAVMNLENFTVWKFSQNYKQPILVKELVKVHDNFLKTKHNNSEKEYCETQKRLIRKGSLKKIFKTSVLIYHLIKSLILAQDERWRRA